MQKMLLTIGLILLIVIGWLNGVKKMVPEKHTDVIESYKSFAEEQVDLEAYGSAIEYYQAIINLDNRAEYYKRLAEIYMLAEKQGDAYETLETCISLYPQEQDVYKQVIYHYYDEGELDKAADFMLEYSQYHGWEDKMATDYLFCRYHYSIKGYGFQDASDYYNGYFIVKLDDTWKLIDSKFRFIPNIDFQNATPTFGTIMGVVVDNHANFIDITGLKYLDTVEQYEEAWSFIGGMALVKKDGKYGYVNTQYKQVLEGYLDASNFVNGISAVKVSEGWGLIDTTGKFVTKDFYQEIKLDEDKIAGFGNVVFAKVNEGYIMLGTNGKQIGKGIFEDVKPFNRGIYAAVKVNGKWGYVDVQGNIVIEPQFEDAKSFGEQLGAVCKEGKWGFVTPTGRVAIEPQFEDAKHLNNGVAPVKIEDEWFYLDLDY